MSHNGFGDAGVSLSGHLPPVSLGVAGQAIFWFGIFSEHVWSADSALPEIFAHILNCS